MKRLFPLLVLLLLAACGIQVDDLGDNWNKGEIDPALLGRWLDETAEGKEKETAIGSIINRGGMYDLLGTKLLRTKKKIVHSNIGKTLRVGNYRFLMTGPNVTYTLFGPVEGKLIRYDIKDDRFYAYNMNPEALRQWLTEKYPQQKNIIISKNCPNPEWGEEHGCILIKITKLGETELKILSEIPDTGIYWQGKELLRKLSNE